MPESMPEPTKARSSGPASLAAGFLLGLGRDLVTNSAASQWNLYVAAAVLALAPVWWLRTWPPGAPGRQLIPRFLIGTAVAALVLAVVSPATTRWAVLMAALAALSAAIIPANPAQQFATLFGVAFVALGVAAIGLGVQLLAAKVPWGGGVLVVAIAAAALGVAVLWRGGWPWDNGGSPGEVTVLALLLIGSLVAWLVESLANQATFSAMVMFMALAIVASGTLEGWSSSSLSGGSILERTSLLLLVTAFTVAGVAWVVAGGMLTVLGAKTWVGGDVLTGRVYVPSGIGLVTVGLAWIGVGIEPWIRGRDSIRGVTPIIIGVGLLGLGLAFWFRGFTLVGVAGIGLGVAAFWQGGWLLGAASWPIQLLGYLRGDREVGMSRPQVPPSG